MTESLSLGLPIFVGIVLGIIEAYFLYSDESSANVHQVLADMVHGIIFCVAGTVVAANIPYIINNFFSGLPSFVNTILLIDENGISLTACIVITIFMKIKMVVSHTIKGISNVGFTEKLWHKLLVAGAVGFSPYYIFMVHEPIKQFVPWFPLLMFKFRQKLNL